MAVADVNDNSPLFKEGQKQTVYFNENEPAGARYDRDGEEFFNTDLQGGPSPGTLIGLTLIWDVPPSCPTAQPLLPIPLTGL